MGTETSQRLAAILKELRLTISTAESCTGGLIAHKITSLAGSSAYFKGSVVSYCDEVKHNVLGVSAKDLETYTAVSQEVATQMAAGVRNLMKTDVGIATTGIAGPTGATETQPVGTVWICVSTESKSITECCHFNGNRSTVIDEAAEQALQMAIALISQ